MTRRRSFPHVANPAWRSSGSTVRWAPALCLALLTMHPACDCDPEPIDVVECAFAVETPDANDTVSFRDTEVGQSRNRSIRITNLGNVVLEAFSFGFAERNGQHYRMGDEAGELRVTPGTSATLRVFFEPLAPSPNLGSTLTVTHARVRDIGCPAFAVSVQGASFEGVDVPDGGDADAGEPDDGGESGGEGGPSDAGNAADGGIIDAGVVTPPDGGVLLPPGAFFSARGALQEARSDFALVTLPDATLLAIGGYGERGQTLSSIERFDPRIGKSRVVAHLRVARADPAAVLLRDGTVAIVGGRTRAVDGLAVDTVELFDPTTEDVSCPPGQGSCSLQDVQQGLGLLPEGRIGPVVSAPASGDLRLIVALGRRLDEAGREVPAEGAWRVSWAGAAGAELLTGSEWASPRRQEVRVVGPDGAILAGLGTDALGALLSDLWVYLPEQDRIAPIAPGPAPILPRVGGAAVLLEDGDVLIATGVDGAGQAVEEVQRLVDPFGRRPGVSTEVQSIAGLALEGRVGPSLHALGNDFLLLAGGLSPQPANVAAEASVLPRRDAELLVPVGDTWLRLAPDNDLATPRLGHASALVEWTDDDDVPEVAVVFLGGTATHPRRTPHPAAERFRLFENAFEVYGLMGPGTAFEANAPSVLYALGGIDPHQGAVSARVRSFDAQSDTFADRLPLDSPRRDHAVARLADENTLLIVGGRDESGQVLASASLYNPFVPFDEPLSVRMTSARANPSATRIDDGSVLICGGQGQGGEALDTCELFLPPSRPGDRSTHGEARFEAVSGRMSIGRVGHSATWMGSEAQVLLVGGGDLERGQVAADVYIHSARQLVARGEARLARRGHIAVDLGSGRVLVAGGEVYLGATAPTAEAEVFVAAQGIFLPVPEPMAHARVGAGALRLDSGDVLIFGGAEFGEAAFPTRSLATAERYLPGPTGVGAFTAVPEAMLTYARSDVGAGEVFGRGIAPGGNHRDGVLASGDERRSPLYFVDELVGPEEETPPPGPPTEGDAGPPADAG